MKIVKFTANNVKRLKAVEINPDGTVQIISGRNAQGKSSVLDAIWLALGGGPAARSTSRPVRDGEETASVEIDLGDYVVTRKWKGDRTTLTVQGADGTKHSSPQAILDGLVGRLSFDPLEFTRRSQAEQRDALMSIVQLPFDIAELAINRAALYDERLDVGRERGLLGSVPTPDLTMPEDETSAQQLLAEINAARRVESAAAATAASIEATRETIAARVKDITQMEADIARLNESVETMTTDLVQPVPGHADELESRLSTLEDLNRKIRDNNRARSVRDNDLRLQTEYSAITDKIDGLDRAKSAGLAAAVFPVDGLGFDDAGVTYNGIPFSQASSAEQIQVSLAMAMNLNPTLKVVRIMDGSLLDPDTLALIAAAATDADYQIWIERVGDNDGGSAVVIEDGEIVASAF
jgi:hypothetical protein